MTQLLEGSHQRLCLPWIFVFKMGTIVKCFILLRMIYLAEGRKLIILEKEPYRGSNYSIINKQCL